MINGEEPKSILERKAYPAFEIIIEINDQNSWTMKEKFSRFVSTNFTIGQTRHFSLTEKLKLSPNDFKIIKILC
jgi:hypothetical protein